MTLHLFKVGLFTLHVSDRRLTFADTTVYDTAANKSIVLWARDALVTIGFTGIAYLDGVPTDRWIVERVTDQQFPERAEPPGMPSGYGGIVGHCPSNRWESIELALRWLRDGLEKWRARASSADRQQLLTIMAAGHALKWRSRRRFDYAPYLAWVGKDAGDSSFTLSHPRRDHVWGSGRYWRQSKFTSIPEGQLRGEEWSELLGNLQAARGSPPEVADANERSFVEAIRRVAARTPHVGHDCMSILLPPPFAAPIRVRFLAEDRSTAHEAVELPLAYSPWIVTPHQVERPKILRGGGWDIRIGMLQVTLECPSRLMPAGKSPPISDVVMRDQPRKGPPR